MTIGCFQEKLRSIACKYGLFYRMKHDTMRRLVNITFASHCDETSFEFDRYDIELNMIDFESIERRLLNEFGISKKKRDDAMRYVDMLGNLPYNRPEELRKSLEAYRMKIEKVIFNNPATIVMWADGTKTIVKCQEGDEFDPEKGLAMAIAKKALGNQGNYYEVLKEWV